jgi:predicted nucleotidyltransferase
MLLNETDLARVVRLVVARCDPDRIYLFGSYAKGSMGPDSDIDLLVVRPTAVPFPVRGRNVIPALAGVAASFDLLFYTPAEIAEEMQDPDGFVSTIIGDSRLLYERGRSVPTAAGPHPSTGSR